MWKGTGSDSLPMDLNLSGFSWTKIFRPSKAFPSPIAMRPKRGIISPPIKRPMAFIESDTATAFKPPNTAYIPPVIPMPQTQIHKASVSVTPNSSGMLNIPLMATDPEYKITGSKTTTYPVRKSTEVIVFVVTSKRVAKNCGTVVSPPFKYLGNKKIAVTTIAIAARVSQAITDKPLS